MKVSLAIILGIFRALVVPVQSEECPATLGQDELSACVSRASDYLSTQFRDITEFSFDLAPSVTLSRACSYYGKNGPDGKDVLIHEAVAEAVAALNESVDFSIYDNDSDGIVDALVIVFPGSGESDSGDPDLIWPQASTIAGHLSALEYDGVRIAGFVSVCENGFVGTLCHELLHTFGLVDLYDTDGPASGGLSKAMWGCTSLMDRGLANDGGMTPPNLNAVELDQLGIGKVDTLSVGHWTLAPGARQYAKISSKSTPLDCFLFESRSDNGWDSHIGGSGLLVYHVDKSDSYAGYSDFYRVTLTAYERWEKNLVNCRPDRECADLVEADPDAESVSQVFFPQPGHNSLSSESNPPLRFSDGTSPSLAVMNISREAGGSVSFDVIEPISLSEVYEFQNSALMTWTVDRSLSARGCDVTLAAEGDENVRKVQATRTSDGLWTCRLDSLEPRTRYRVAIRLTTADGAKFSLVGSLRTKSITSGSYPYIYLPPEGRNPDGSFRKGTNLPLHVYNVQNVAEIRWSFGGKPLSQDAELLSVSGDGELRAEVYYEKGGRDVIIKQIICR